MTTKTTRPGGPGKPAPGKAARPRAKTAAPGGAASPAAAAAKSAAPVATTRPGAPGATSRPGAPGAPEYRQTWLVLGASSSVARAFARQAAAADSDIVLAGRDIEDLRRTAEDVAIRGRGHVAVLEFDAADIASHDAFVAECRDRARFLNVFVAVGAMPDQAEIDADFALAEGVVAVNYTGVMSVLHRLAPLLEAQGDGRVVVLSSVAGDRGRLKNYVYGSAKAGLNTYLQGLRARLYRKGVSVTTVKPGFMDTDMTWGLPGMFLVASPEQAAAACLKAARKRRNVVYFPLFWWAIMTIIRHIPEFIFKKMSI